MLKMILLSLTADKTKRRHLFWWLNGFTFRISSKKWPLRQRVLKTNVTLVQILELMSWIFTWESFFGDRHLYLDAIKWQLKPGMIDLAHTKTTA